MAAWGPRPVDPASGPLQLLSALGLGVAVWGLGWRHPAAGGLGLGLILAGCAGLYADLARTVRKGERQQRLLRDLNDNLDGQVQARTVRLMETIGDLEAFNRMITHDLRSPLTAMLVTLETLAAEQEGLPDEVRDRIRILHGCAERMRDLLQGLYELAAISGRLPTIKEVDVSHYAGQVFRQLQTREPERAVHWDIEPGLAVFGDPNLIQIALENVLGNAWKYTVGRDPARIQVRRGPGPGRTIEVQDNGRGFDMAKADLLFLPFQRLHTDPQIPGSGIGLSIVKRVMDKHSGRASARALPGQGAVFRLEFPAALEAGAGETGP